MSISRTSTAFRRTALTGALAASLFPLTACAEDTGETDGVDDVVTDATGDIGDLEDTDDTEPDAGNGTEGAADGERTLAELRGELDDYTGEAITVAAQVEEVLSDKAFTLATEDDSVEPMLVVSAETAQVAEGEDVIVTGTLQESFLVTEVEDLLGTNLDDDLYATWQEDHYIVATAVNPDDPDPADDAA